MISEEIQEKIYYFHKDKYKIIPAQGSILLEEKKNEGRTELICICGRDSIVFPTPEQNVLPYLDGTIDNATSCADKFVFTENETGWDLHIIEFKKTMTTASLEKSKRQFRMGIYNAQAVAAFLGMEIKEIYLYSGYRNDNISAIPADSLIAMHASNNLDALRLIREWREGACQMKVDRPKDTYRLNKIVLDQNGCGQVEIPMEQM